MRITDGMRYATTIQSEQGAAMRLQQLSQQAASGNVINAPSDDPAAYAQLTALNGRLNLLESRATNNTNAAGDLDLASNVLTQASDKLTRLKQIAVAMADGTADEGSRANAAIEVKSLKAGLIALGNTRGATGYLFGGSKTQTPPFANDGTFGGNDAPLNLPTSDGTTVVANASGAKAFTAAGGSDLFANIDKLASALTRNNADDIRGMLGQLDDDHRQIVAAQTDTGLNSDRLKTSADVMQNAIGNVKQQSANLTQGDAVTLYSAFSAAQISYTRALTVSQQVLSTLSQASR